VILTDLEDNDIMFSEIETMSPEKGDDDYETTVISLLEDCKAINTIVVVKGIGHEYQIQLGVLDPEGTMFAVNVVKG